MLAIFAEFESDLLKLRTREGMAVAKANDDLAEVFTISRPDPVPRSGRVNTGPSAVGF